MFRSFLLCSGPAVLKEILTEELYDHFLYFHTAIRILSSPNSSRDFTKYAGDCLRYFDHIFGGIYGEEYLVYNVHALSYAYRRVCFTTWVPRLNHHISVRKLFG